MIFYTVFNDQISKVLNDQKYEGCILFGMLEVNFSVFDDYWSLITVFLFVYFLVQSTAKIILASYPILLKNQNSY